MLAATHVSPLAAVAPVAVLLGACSALFMPASMAMMPSLVDSSRLTSANSVYAGFVQAGPATAFAVDAGSYLVSAVSLGLIAVAAGTSPGVPAPAGGAAEAGAPEAAGPAGEGPPVPGSVWQLLRRSRVLQIILVVVLSANFALVGTTEVALPTLAHARFGADGYGAVLTCVAVAALAGALVVGRLGERFRPVTLIAGSLVVGAAAIAAAPFIGGLLTRHLGPTPIFPISGALLALVMAYGLTQREFRDFGTPDDFGTLAEEPSPTPA